MRKTNINQTITRADVKKGDKIRIEREIIVTDVRTTRLGQVYDAKIVTANGSETLALTPKETVTLLERDQSLDFGDDAKVVTWTVASDEDTDAPEDYFAVRIQDEDAWLSSDEDSYSDDDHLERAILNGEFGDYVEGTFKVLSPKPKPSLVSGGLISGALPSISQIAGRPLTGNRLPAFIGR